MDFIIDGVSYNENEIVSLDDIEQYLNNLKSDSYEFPDNENKKFICQMGVDRCGLALRKAYKRHTITETDENGEEIRHTYYYPMSSQETLLCAMYAYQYYAVKMHDMYAHKTMNLKTKGFSTTGAGDRTKEFMRTIWWLDGQIRDIAPAIFATVNGYYGDVREMRGDLIGRKEFAI